MTLDTVTSIETPEGIDFDLIPSGPIARVLAYVIDFLIRAVVLIVVGILLGVFGTFGQGIMLLFYFAIEWLYPVIFEITKGATPGKKSMKLKVVHDDGTPVTLSSSLLRNLLRAVDILPIFYLSGLFTMVCNNRFKRLGDLAAGTIVIQMPEPLSVSLDSSVQPLPPPVTLTPEEQKAFIQFTLRSGELSEARQLELAQPLQTILNCNDGELVKQVQQIGAFLLGGVSSLDNDKTSQPKSGKNGPKRSAVSIEKNKDSSK